MTKRGAALVGALFLALGARSLAGTPGAAKAPSRSTPAKPGAGIGRPGSFAGAISGNPVTYATFVPGRIVVKFRGDGPRAVTECAQAAFERRLALRDATADRSDSLDRLIREVGVRNVRAVLPERYGLGLAAARARAAEAKRRLAESRPSRGLRDERPLAEVLNAYVLDFSRSLDPLWVSRLFAADEHVAYAQPDYLVAVQEVPNDPYFGSAGSWGQAYDDLWGLKRISCPGAWDVSKGDGILVAVVDTGLDMAHADVAANLWSNPGEVPGNDTDDDGNGYVDDVHGWNYANGSADPTDDNGHGTHVSGTIAAVGDNAIGVIGVAPRARVLPLKALDARGSGASSTLAAAVVYAASLGADVINNSWSCQAPCPSDPLVEDAVRLAHGLGAVVVFAAGNATDDVVAYSPQNQPEAVVVSATDPFDAPTSFSNFGFVDVAAPGGGTNAGPPAEQPARNILSLRAAGCSPGVCPPELVVGGSFLRQAGTSMAAPHVSGLAALILSRTPGLTNEQVRQLLRVSAVDLGTPGFDTSFGYGRIDASAAVARELALEAVILGPGSRPIPITDVVSVEGRVQGPGLASWRLDYGAGTLPSAWTTIDVSAFPVAGGRLAYWSIAALPDGEYTLRLTAQSTTGATYEDRKRVLIDRVSFSAPGPSGISLFRSGETVTLRGTVAIGFLQSYTLKLRRADGEEVGASGLTAANGGFVPVVDGVLGTWVVPDAQEHFTIELTAFSAVQTVTKSVRVAADRTLHPGWPKPLGLIGSDSVSLNLAEHLVAADVDRDGRDDLLVAYGADVRVFDHAGALLPGWPQSVDPAGHGVELVYSSPAVGDVTGDGLPDVVAATNLGGVYVWGGDGTLAPGWPAYIGSWNARVSLADLDGDGVAEIVLSGSERVGAYAASGLPLPGWPVDFPGVFLMHSAAVGDMDGDGKAEVVVATGETPSNLFALSSTGQVLPGWPVATFPTQEPGSQNYAIPALGDLDGDGDLEVVVGPGDGRILAFHHTGAPVAGWPRAVVAQQFNYPVVADLDDDGRDDVVAAAYTEGGPTTTFYVWHGDGTAFAGWPITLDLGGVPADLGNGQAAVADVDGDGQVEVLAASDVGYPAYSMKAFRLDGTSIPSFPKPTARASMWATVPAVADLDGDGLLELAWVDRSASLHVWDLPAPASSRRPWPMFGRSPRRDSATTTTARPTLTATASGATSVALSWTPLIGATGYRLDVATDPGFSHFLAGHANEAVGNVLSYALGGLSPARRYFARVRGEWPASTSSSSAPASATTAAAAARLFTLTPCRVLDTRNTGGPTGGMPLTAGSRNVFVVGGACGVPADAAAIVSNLTLVGGTAPGSLQVLPGHLASSLTSSLGIPVGRARANNAIVRLSADGDGTVAVVNGSPGTVHFILDVSGFFR